MAFSDKIKSTARAVKNGGHSSSGGHNSSARAGSKLKSNVSAKSRINQRQWDFNDGISGGDEPLAYQEYPKHIYNDPNNDRNYIVVNSEEEEKLALSGTKIVREEEERHRLLALADVKGVPVDKRWGPSKMTKAIEEAGFDSTIDPFH